MYSQKRNVSVYLEVTKFGLTFPTGFNIVLYILLKDPTYTVLDVCIRTVTAFKLLESLCTLTLSIIIRVFTEAQITTKQAGKKL